MGDPADARTQALLDVVSGQLNTSFAIYSVAIPHIRSGKIKALDEQFAWSDLTAGGA